MKDEANSTFPLYAQRNPILVAHCKAGCVPLEPLNQGWMRCRHDLAKTIDHLKCGAIQLVSELLNGSHNLFPFGPDHGGYGERLQSCQRKPGFHFFFHLGRGTVA